jgi:hypothetical protein
VWSDEKALQSTVDSFRSADADLGTLRPRAKWGDSGGGGRLRGETSTARETTARQEDHTRRWCADGMPRRLDTT